MLSPRASCVAQSLKLLAVTPPASWLETGPGARPNLHGLIRYPAMMVPSMQGDIIDTLLASIGKSCHVLDPFVGSGTTMTEAGIRGLDFTGVDINPLAALVCEAKANVDSDINFEKIGAEIKNRLSRDKSEKMDVHFPNIEKWFSRDAILAFCRIRRAIIAVESSAARKVFWTTFAETIRSCSNSRTSTYKLHIRPSNDILNDRNIAETFDSNLRATLSRIATHKQENKNTNSKTRKTNVICDDIRRASLVSMGKPDHILLITSPPYGDNVSTIPYGQFSYLALRWIPLEDLPENSTRAIFENTHSLDTASLGGSLKGAIYKVEAMTIISENFRTYSLIASNQGKDSSILKVGCFLYDFFESLDHIKSQQDCDSHWILTTGNKTAAGIPVPFDLICSDIIHFLGGKMISNLHRKLPNKRMPLRNSEGSMITRETTIVAEFV